jgi:hypothetical protein
MIGVTLFGLFLTPVFYLLVQKRRTAVTEPSAVTLPGPLALAPAAHSGEQS